MRLDREFSAMLVKIADRRETLHAVEKQLQSLDRLRAGKQGALRDLERKLVVLLEQQHGELGAIRRRQALKGTRMVEDPVPAGSSSAVVAAPAAPATSDAAGSGGVTPQQVW
jgi:hypothetical protein